MLRKFKVNINGKEYFVEMEELSASAQMPVQASQPVASAPAPVTQAAPAPTGNGETVTAPMPGNILKVLVSVGDTVSLEQPLVILEAMKMENELVAPVAGTVTAIHTTAGSAIDVGKPIITIN